MSKVLGILVARKGSKGLKNKNIKKLKNKPLILWVVDEAIKSKKIDKLILSTNSDEIIQICKGKIEIPFKRPDNISNDSSSVIDVLKHSVSYYEKRKLFFDYILLLQPTSPFTILEDIDKSINLILSNKKIDTIISAYKSEQTHPDIMFYSKKGKVDWYNKNEKINNRQNLSELFIRSGNIYLFKRELLNRSTIYGEIIKFIEIPFKRAISIDNEDDFKLAKYYSNEKS